MAAAARSLADSRTKRSEVDKLISHQNINIIALRQNAFTLSPFHTKPFPFF
jgi:hypothetical protein